MSATANSENKEAVLPSETLNAVFKEAMLQYQKALKTGIQLQEESLKLWKELLSKLSSPEEFRARIASLNSQALPASREHLAGFLENFTRTSDTTLALFQKSIAPFQAGSISEAQSRVQDLLECSLSAMRGNVQTALDTNAKIMASWKDLVDRVSSAAAATK